MSLFTAKEMREITFLAVEKKPEGTDLDDLNNLAGLMIQAAQNGEICYDVQQMSPYVKQELKKNGYTIFYNDAGFRISWYKKK